MAKIGIGMIGSGGRLRGVFHEILSATDQVEMRAVCDPSDYHRGRALELFNKDAKVYDDYTQLVRDPDIEWVMVGSWNCFHARHAIAAFEAGKHVFCEKPLALTLEDCVAMRDAWKKSGRQFTIGFTLRYSPHYRKVKQMIDDGMIGEIISMEFNETLDFNHGGFIHCDWRRKTENAGTHLLEKCCHDVDLTNMMIGSVAKRVASFGNLRFFTPENEKLMEEIGPNPDNNNPAFTWGRPQDAKNAFVADKDILDNQVAILQYANGVNVTFHTNCSTLIPERRMYICGTHGTIRADVMAGTIQYRKLGWKTPVEDCAAGSAGGHGGGDSILGASIAKTMLEGAPSVTSIEDGLRSAITCFAIDEAQRSGTVVDVAPYWKKAGVALA